MHVRVSPATRIARTSRARAASRSRIQSPDRPPTIATAVTVAAEGRRSAGGVEALAPGDRRRRGRPVDLADGEARRARTGGRWTGSPRRTAAGDRSRASGPWFALARQRGARLGQRRLAVHAAGRPRRQCAPHAAPSSRQSAESPRRRARPAGTRRRRSRRHRSCRRGRPAAPGRAGPCRPPWPRARRRHPSFTATVGPPSVRPAHPVRASASAAASTSSTRAIRRASAAFGRNTSADPEQRRGRRRPIAPTGPSSCRTTSSGRARGPRRTAPAAGRRPGPWRKNAPEWTWRARATEARRDRVDVERVDRARAPSASPGPSRWSGSRSRRSAEPGRRRTPTTSMPRAASASSMNRPSASSPTTPTNATRSPSRAAPHAKIADELPTVSRIDVDEPLDLAEDRHRIRVGDDDVRVDLADDEEVDVAAAAAATLRYARYQPSPGSGAAASRSGRSCQGRPAASASSTSRRSRAAPGRSPGTRRGRRAPASRPRPRRTARPARRSRRPRQAVSTCASNVASSTPPDSRTHGDGERRVELGAGLAPAGSVRDRRVVRELGLEDVAADRGQPARGLDDDAPAGLAGQLLALDERERQRLHEQREVAPHGRPRHLGDEPLLVRGVRRLRVVVDEELGGRRARSASPARRSSRRGPG